MTLKPALRSCVLQRPAVHRDIFKQNDSVSTAGADPIELAAPVLGALDQTGQRPHAQRIADRDLDLMPFPDQPEVKGTEIAIVADTQETHQAVNFSDLRAMRPCCAASRLNFCR